MDSLKTQTMASLMFSCMAAKLQVTQVKQCRVSKQQRDILQSLAYQGCGALEVACVHTIACPGHGMHAPVSGAE